MILTTNELKSLNFIPNSNYKMGRAFPPEFKLPRFATIDVYKKLPLFIQVRYETSVKLGVHALKASNI
jgi:hypothetical protein